MAVKSHTSHTAATHTVSRQASTHPISRPVAAKQPSRKVSTMAKPKYTPRYTQTGGTQPMSKYQKAQSALGAASALLPGRGAKAHAAAPPRRRQKRIVFSEKQWEFTRTLINAVTHRGSMPHFRHRKKKKSFF